MFIILFLQNSLLVCLFIFLKYFVGGKFTEEQLTKLKFNYENYKTLINTGIVSAIPAFGVILGLPFAFNAWLTGIQKKAGKIGIMQAVEKIDNPKLFVNGKESTDDKLSFTAEKETKTKNLIELYGSK